MFGSDRQDAITTTAFAQPIHENALAAWLAEFDRNLDADLNGSGAWSREGEMGVLANKTLSSWREIVEAF